MKKDDQETHIHILQKNVVTNSNIQAQTVHIGDKIYYQYTKQVKKPNTLQVSIKDRPDGGYQVDLKVFTPSGAIQSMPVDIEIAPDQLRLGIVLLRMYRQQTGGGIQRGLPHGTSFTPDWDPLKLGNSLFNTLLPPDSAPRLLLDQFLDELAQRKLDNLQLLFYAENPELQALPFELLCRDQDEAPLAALYENLLIGRGNCPESEYLPPCALPLRILVVSALPYRQEVEAFADLEREQEIIATVTNRANLQLIQALGDLPSNRKVVVEFLEVATLENIQEALSKGKHHVLHISGHGFYLDAQESGFINLETENGELAQVSAQELAQTLSPYTQHLRLVYLAVSESGDARTESVAQALLQKGIPAVVAMRYPVLDALIVAFTESFYQQLSLGASLANALHIGRKNIQKTLGSSDGHVLALYLNRPMGSVFDLHAPAEDMQHFFQVKRPPLTFMAARDGKGFLHPSLLVAGGFVGRRQKLALLNRLFKPSAQAPAHARTIGIYGIGGIGKTTLAARFAENFQNKGIAVIAFAGEVSEDTVLFQLVQSIAPEERSDYFHFIEQPRFKTLEKLRFVLPAIGGAHGSKGKAILLFDNFEDNQHPTSGAASPTLLKSEALLAFFKTLVACIQESKEGLYLLLTTRYPAEELPLYYLELEKFDFPDTYKLINRMPGLVHFSLHQRYEVHERLGGHPRAIDLLDAYYRQTPDQDWNSLQNQLAQVHQTLSEHDLLLGLHWNALHDEARCLLSAFALFTHATPTHYLFFIFYNTLPLLQQQENQEQALGLYLHQIQQLNQRSLLYSDGQHTLEIHRLVSDWVKKQAFLSKETQIEIHRFSGRLFWQVYTEDKTLTHLLPAARYHALEAKDWVYYASASFEYKSHLKSIGQYSYAYEILIELEQQVQHLDTELEIQLNNNLGILEAHFGRRDAAMKRHQNAFELAQKPDANPDSLATQYLSVGTEYLKRGEPATALEYFKQAFTAYESRGDQNGMGKCLSNMGIIYAEYGEIDRARAVQEASLRIRRETEDQEGIMISLEKIAELEQYAGRYESAKKLFEEALELRKQSGPVDGISSALHNLGIIHADLGMPDKALEYYFKALEIRLNVHEYEVIGNIYHNIGTAYMMLGGEQNLQNAYLNFQEAIKWKTRNQELGTLGTSYHNIGLLFSWVENWEQAIVYLEQALELKQQHQKTTELITTLTSLADAYAATNDLPKSLAYAEAAVGIARQIESPAKLAKAQTHLAKVYLKLNRQEDARILLVEILPLFQQHPQLGSAESIQEMLLSIAPGS